MEAAVGQRQGIEVDRRDVLDPGRGDASRSSTTPSVSVVMYTGAAAKGTTSRWPWGGIRGPSCRSLQAVGSVDGDRALGIELVVRLVR